MYTLEQILQIVEFHIEQINYNRQPQNLYSPVHYILSLGGKRIRPALMLMACNLYSDGVEEAIKPAIGMEIFHNFTLLHDDLMDKADKRRNQLTVHKKWNANRAILSGDAMLILAYQFIGNTKTPLLKSILDIFTKTAMEICEGQQYDMDFEQRQDVTEDEYIEMIRLKTAVLIACCLQSGALIGGASNKDAMKLFQTGIYTGLAFQLQDDLLDTFGDPHSFGKEIGGDIICNKKTFLHLQMMQRASDAQKAIIHDVQSDINCPPEEKIAVIKSIYETLGVREITNDRILNYYNRAMQELIGLNLPVERLRMFNGTIDMLLGRKS